MEPLTTEEWLSSSSSMRDPEVTAFLDLLENFISPLELLFKLVLSRPNEEEDAELKNEDLKRAEIREFATFLGLSKLKSICCDSGEAINLNFRRFKKALSLRCEFTYRVCLTE